MNEWIEAIETVEWLLGLSMGLAAKQIIAKIELFRQKFVGWRSSDDATRRSPDRERDRSNPDE